MKQILNIFRKDVRHHWMEIAIFLLVLAAFVWDEPSTWKHVDFESRLHSFLTGFLNVAVILAEWLMIVRVIQSESLVGDRRFWLTRPYDWKKLLAAKLIFLVIFINVPLFIAGVILAIIAGFSSPWFLVPGILEAQLLSIVLALPVMALTVVTANIGQLFLGLLLVVAYTAGVAVLGEYIPNIGFPDDMSGVAGIIFVLGCVSAFLYQYAKRKTLWTRLTLVSVAILITATLFLAPYGALANYDYPPTANEQLPVQFGLDANKPTGRGGFKKDDVELDLPIKFSGLQSGTAISVDGAMLTLEPSGQPSWNSGWHSTYQKLMPNGSSFRLDFALKKSFFEKVKSQPIKAHIALAIRIFRNKETRRIVVQNGEFNVPEIGVCKIEKRYRENNLRCRYVADTPTFVTTFVSTESTCPQPKPKAGSAAPPPVTMYDFSGANDDPGPLSPVDTVTLYFQSWDVNEAARDPIPSICPGTPLTIAIQEEVKKTQAKIDISGIKLEDYAQTTDDSDSFVFVK